MILLDTNVVSEPMRPQAEQRVIAWLDAQPVETLFLSTVSLAELLGGIARLPDGRRKRGLREGLSGLLETLFAGRILPFDTAAAGAYADLVAATRAQGRTIGFADGQIAATAMAHGLAIATRDTAPFHAAGLEVIDPWRGTAG